MQNITKRLAVWTFIVTLILMIPVVMQFTEEVDWTEAIAYSVILLAAASTYELTLALTK